jgi:hypothetical protein
MNNDVNADDIYKMVNRLLAVQREDKQRRRLQDALKKKYPTKLSRKKNKGDLYRCIKTSFIEGEGYLDSLQDKGFCCLTEVKDSPLMWAHYASAHTGICVGFDTAGMLFPRQSFPITYSMQRIRVNASDLLRPSGGPVDPDVLKSMLLTKAVHWEYEKEWRFLGCHPQDGYFANGGEMVNFDRCIIREVIFGMRCNDKTKSFVRSLLNDLDPCPHFSAVERSEATYDLRIHP